MILPFPFQLHAFLQGQMVSRKWTFFVVRPVVFKDVEDLEDLDDAEVKYATQEREVPLR